ncbi:ATP-binding protein [Megalodesulfovibrio paquesii]
MESSPYTALRLKIIGATLLLSLTPLFSLGYIIHTSFSQAYKEKVERALRIIMEDKRNAIDMFLEASLSQLRTVAESYTMDELSDQDRLTRILATLQGSFHAFMDLGVIDQDGNHIAYAGPYKLKGFNYSQEVWFNEVMRRGIYVSDTFLGFRNYPHCIVAVLRREKDKVWAMRATVDTDVFNTLVRAVPMGRQAEAFLVNGKSVLQTMSSRHGPVLGTAELPMEGPFSGAHVSESTLPNGHILLTGMTWLQQANWLLVVQEDTAEEMTPLLRTQRQTFIIVLAGGLVILIGAFITSGSIVARLAQSDKEKAIMDAALMQSGKIAAIGKLAAGVAHEVNNPLTLIRESAGWIRDLLGEEDKEHVKNYDEIDEALIKIDQHVERARTVTHRLLGFARRMEPMQEHIDLNAVLEQTTKFLESEALYRSIAIHKAFDRNLPSITTDPAQLQQVFLNLLENAIDAIDRQGEITIATRQEGEDVIATVTDSGPGIPRHIQDKIFDPFFTTKKVGEGTGLGLSISYGIIEKLGGHIAVESEEGHGATFTVRLPLAAR